MKLNSFQETIPNGTLSPSRLDAKISVLQNSLKLADSSFRTHADIKIMTKEMYLIMCYSPRGDCPNLTG